MGDTIKIKKGLKLNRPVLSLSELTCDNDTGNERLVYGGVNGAVEFPNMKDIEKVNSDLADMSYNSIAEMKASTKQIGKIIKTYGYYTLGDGGGAYYVVVAAGTGTNDGGGYINLNSGLQAKLLIENSEVNIRQFGAKGDGVADDVQSINKAISFSVKNGAVCRFPKGQYATYGDFGYTLLDSEIDRTIILEGCPGSKILFLGNNKIHRFWVYGNYKTDAIVRNLTIIGNKSNYTTIVDTQVHALRVNQFRNVIIENCIIDNFEGLGIASGDNNGIVNIRNNRVLNCGDLFSLANGDANGDGIYTHGNNHIIIENNYVYNDIMDTNTSHMMGRTGICTEYNTMNATIRNNTVFGYNRAIHIEGDAYNSTHIIENNKTYGSPCGIMVWGERGNTIIRGNYITNKQAFKARSRVNAYGCDANYGFGIAIMSDYNNTNLTIEDNVVKGYISSDTFMLQPLLFTGTGNAVNEDGVTVPRMVDGVNMIRNIFDCGLKQANEFTNIFDNTASTFKKTVVIPAQCGIVADNVFNVIGKIWLFISASYKNGAVERNSFIANGLFSGVQMIFSDATGAGYTESQKHSVFKVVENSFVIKGKDLDWHALSLEISNDTALSTLIIENNVFNIATNTTNTIEIGCRNWLNDNLYSKVELNNNIFKHQGTAILTALKRFVISKQYNIMHNLITNIKTRAYGVSPYKEGVRNIQYLLNNSDTQLFGNYMTGDIIRYQDNSKTIVTTDGYITNAVWIANTLYHAVDASSINPFIYSGNRVFKCIIGGTTGAILPTVFSTAILGDLIADGTATWQYVGLLATTSYKV